MSGKLSDRRRREATHRDLTRLLADGGPLHDPPPPVSAFLTEDLLDEVTDEYRRLKPAGEIGGKAVIITAGPPGAGKSQALRTLLNRHRRIDPDEIKSLILDKLERAGLLDSRRLHTLSDADPVSPAELSLWVHKAANDVAEDARLISLSLQENFAMEGTLQWDKLPADYSVELADSDYEELTVLDIEVRRSVAIEQAKDRWWVARHDGTPLGGRFMADESFDRYYPDRPEVSITATRARELYDSALAAGVEVRIACVSRDASGTQHTAVVSENGVSGWPTPGPLQKAPRGAVCIHCGRTLRTDHSIARGIGPTCVV